MALDYDLEVTSGHQPDEHYKLPDEQIFKVNNLERFKCPEILFKPSLIGRETVGVGM